MNFEQKSRFITDANPKNSGFCTSIGPEIENIFQQLKARIYTYTEKVIWHLAIWQNWGFGVLVNFIIQKLKSKVTLTYTPPLWRDLVKMFDLKART